MARVIIDSPSKSYNSDRVRDNINLKINEGEFFVFVGPSGRGESSILRLIVGLIKPSSSKMKFNNTISKTPTLLYSLFDHRGGKR
jgi:ABC-type sugar transport system ATPase subunit